MLTGARRIVTGHNDDGQSVAIINDAPPQVMVDPATGAGLAEIWASAAVPETLTPFVDSAKALVTLAPDPGGVRFRLFAVAPGEVKPADFPAARAAAQRAYGALDGADALVASERHPEMHRTKTLDVVIALQGSLTLVLDTEDIVLRPGDTVVQRGTAHAWANSGADLAVGFVILMDATEDPAR
ncbi:MAG: cupin domain-containing protein [Pseudomonadota bacterium]